MKKKKSSTVKSSVPVSTTRLLKSSPSDLPMKIPCHMCGTAKAARTDIILKRIEQYGSLEELLAKYECRDCRKKPGATAPSLARTKKGKKNIGVEEVDAEGNVVYFWQKPGWAERATPAPFRPLESQVEYIRAWGTTCALPGLFLDNNKFCDGCVYYPTCACPSRRLKSEGVRIDAETGEEKPLTYYMKKKLGLIATKSTSTVNPGKKMSYHMRKKLGLLKWTRKK